MSSDPNPQGGSLTDMAVEGTKVPSNAATPNTIPSKPRPDQITSPSTDGNNLGASTLAGAADNASDVTGAEAGEEVVTGKGDSLPSEIGSKRLQHLTNPDLSKGHGRADKHARSEE